MRQTTAKKAGTEDRDPFYRFDLFTLESRAGVPRSARPVHGFLATFLRCCTVAAQGPRPTGPGPRSLCGFADDPRVGDSGFEPLTSSASRKRSPPELIALVWDYVPAKR